MQLKVATDFSKTPGPRYIAEGDYSGELFRQSVLWPYVQRAKAEHQNLTVCLDGTAGYGTSFLEEAFGGLIREHGMSYEELKQLLNFVSEEEDYLVEDIDGYMKDAKSKA